MRILIPLAIILAIVNVVRYLQCRPDVMLLDVVEPAERARVRRQLWWRRAPHLILALSWLCVTGFLFLWHPGFFLLAGAGFFTILTLWLQRKGWLEPSPSAEDTGTATVPFLTPATASTASFPCSLLFPDARTFRTDAGTLTLPTGTYLATVQWHIHEQAAENPGDSTQVAVRTRFRGTDGTWWQATTHLPAEHLVDLLDAALEDPDAHQVRWLGDAPTAWLGALAQPAIANVQTLAQRAVVYALIYQGQSYRLSMAQTQLTGTAALHPDDPSHLLLAVTARSADEAPLPDSLVFVCTVTELALYTAPPASWSADSTDGDEGLIRLTRV
jgi:hypothetical protein